jgi:anti-sigma factor RsiW
MRCQDVQNQLKSFSLGELPMDVRQTVQDHVAECDACRAELAKIDALAGVLAAAQTPPTPSGFTARVLATARQRLKTDQIEPWNLIGWWRLTSVPMHAAAAAALVIGLAVGLLMGQAAAPLAPLAADKMPSDPVDTYPLDYLGEAPGGSLADDYFALVATTME